MNANETSDHSETSRLRERAKVTAIVAFAGAIGVAAASAAEYVFSNLSPDTASGNLAIILGAGFVGLATLAYVNTHPDPQIQEVHIQSDHPQ